METRVSLNTALFLHDLRARGPEAAARRRDLRATTRSLKGLQQESLEHVRDGRLELVATDRMRNLRNSGLVEYDAELVWVLSERGALALDDARRLEALGYAGELRLPSAADNHEPLR